MITQLQKVLKERSLPALIVTRNNMFLGEDVLPEDNLIRRLTGFDGSAGTLLLTPDHGFLFVDGRYRIQARRQTDPKAVTVIDLQRDVWTDLADLCQRTGLSAVAYDPWCVSVDEADFLRASGFNLIPTENFPVRASSMHQAKVFEHRIEYAGRSSAEKCLTVLQHFPRDVDAFLVCRAGQVSWLTNLRAELLPDAPIFQAFALLKKNGEMQIFSDETNNFGSRPLADLASALAEKDIKTLMIDPHATPDIILRLMPQHVILRQCSEDLIGRFQEVKNETELDGFRQAHVRDGVAVTKFLYWLERQSSPLTELDVVAKLHEFRSTQDLFFSESFGTISATGAHGAIVHYQPTAETNGLLKAGEMLLLDSGGQYFDGTTDVTRTIALGSPSQEMIDSFTQVLKAHLALASLVFPVRTLGSELDAVARNVLRRYGKNYAHGTGHGVGHFSNVHEGPFRISPNGNVSAQAHIVTSIEPGYYAENAYGIRIENLYEIVPAEKEGFLRFENLTLIPIDKRLINVYLLSGEEQALLDDYHRSVWNRLAPMMNEDEKKWLKEACAPLKR